MFTEVSLKKNAWHAKLQKFVFGRIPYRDNFCPYFWLTIFCILALPFAGLFWAAVGSAMLIVGGPYYLLEKLFDIFSAKVCKPYRKRKVAEYVKTMSDESALRLFGYIYGNYSGFSYLEEEATYIPTFGRWSDLKPKAREIHMARWTGWKEQVGDNWRERILAAREKQLKKQKELDVIIAEGKGRRKQFYNSLVKYTKILVYLPIGTVVIYLLYWLGRLGLVIHEHWTSIWSAVASLLSWIWLGLPWVFLILGCVIALSFLVGGVVALIKKCSFPGKELIGRTAGTVWSPFRSVGGFFAMYFRAFKDDHCPSIEWEE